MGEPTFVDDLLSTRAPRREEASSGSGLTEVRVEPLAPEMLSTIIGGERTTRLEAAAEAAGRTLAGRTVFNVNSTAAGGGVAEMLQTLLAYGRALGIDTRWLVEPPGIVGRSPTKSATSTRARCGITRPSSSRW